MPPYPGTAMETAIARGGGPSRLEVARAPLNGPGGPQAGSLRFPGGFVCEKMRESQTACKELVNTRRADLRLGGGGGWLLLLVLCLLPQSSAGCSLRDQPFPCMHRWGFAAKIGFLGVSLVPTKPAILSSTPGCPLEQNMFTPQTSGRLRCQAGREMCVCVPIRAPRPFLPDHPIAGEAREGGRLAPDTLVLGFLLLLL